MTPRPHACMLTPIIPPSLFCAYLHDTLALHAAQDHILRRGHQIYAGALSPAVRLHDVSAAEGMREGWCVRMSKRSVEDTVETEARVSKRKHFPQA